MSQFVTLGDWQSKKDSWRTVNLGLLFDPIDKAIAVQEPASQDFLTEGHNSWMLRSSFRQNRRQDFQACIWRVMTLYPLSPLSPTASQCPQATIPCG
jgi:hypothetical protein